MTRTGTNHFVNRSAAIQYYKAYEGKYAEEAVARKIDGGEIQIGEPALKAGQKLLIDKEEGRYIIEEQN